MKQIRELLLIISLPSMVVANGSAPCLSVHGSFGSVVKVRFHQQFSQGSWTYCSCRELWHGQASASPAAGLVEQPVCCVLPSSAAEFARICQHLQSSVVLLGVVQECHVS